MNTLLEVQIDALGTAPALAILAKRGGKLPSGLTKNFRKSGQSSESLAAFRMSLPAGAERDALAPDDSLPKTRFYPNLGILVGEIDREGLAALSSSPAVARVEAVPVMSLIRPVATSARTPTAALSWGIKAMKVDKVWSRGFTGSGVLVGHLDTGIDGSHPALVGAIRHFSVAALQSGAISEPVAKWDTGSHGTHTAGTICARQVKVGAKHVSFGVAPGAELASATVIEGGQVTERILSGIDWCVGKGIRILNLSLGLRGYWSNFEPIIEILRELDILPIVAVGNEGPNTSRSPGNYANVLSVGAIDRNGLIPAFSSSQGFARPVKALVPDLVAPGVAIDSCIPHGDYASEDGTSMATPHVSGLAALLMEADPNATSAEVEAAILASCAPSPDLTRSARGLPNALAALEFLIDT